MRLLNAHSKKLEVFLGTEIPPYAILSHVWRKEEASFQDFHNAGRNMIDKAEGFRKIFDACKQARHDGLDYIWVDTCCINKESSTELSEAVNSMFQWYRHAQVCYAHLTDVQFSEDKTKLDASFAKSKWFTRGWTLQELLAPLRVVFFSDNWIDLGTKATLETTISKATGIQPDVIIGGYTSDFWDIPIATKMSWAADRETSRVEDIAYCLMGLFDVNMPLLYGEGKKAFIRLQHEIIRQSNDHTIFAWRAAEPALRGLLAHSPSEFRDSKDIIPRSVKASEVSEVSITNIGIRIKLRVANIRFDRKYMDNFDGYDRHGRLLVELNASTLSNQPIRFIIQTTKLTSDQFIRLYSNEFYSEEVEPNLFSTRTTFIQEDLPYLYHYKPISVDVQVIVGPRRYRNITVDSHPPISWHATSATQWMFKESTDVKLGVLVFTGDHGMVFAIAVASRDGRAWTEIVPEIDRQRALKAEDIYKLYETKVAMGSKSQPLIYLDRSSVDLPNGLSVHVSVGVANKIKVEIKQAPVQRWTGFMQGDGPRLAYVQPDTLLYAGGASNTDGMQTFGPTPPVLSLSSKPPTHIPLSLSSPSAYHRLQAVQNRLQEPPRPTAKTAKDPP